MEAKAIWFEFGVGERDEMEFMLSQDFFCTPDYITPTEAQILNTLDYNKENDCTKSPEKIKTGKPTKQRQALLSSTGVVQKNHSYVSQSAMVLRCRVMPPPCMKNPYLMDDSGVDIDPFGSSRSKCEAKELSATDDAKLKSDGV